LAGLMTLAGVVVGQYALRRREESKKEEEIEALRDSLAVELRSYDEWLEWLLYAAHDLEKMRENAYGLSEQQYEEAFETELQARRTRDGSANSTRRLPRPSFGRTP